MTEADSAANAASGDSAANGVHQRLSDPQVRATVEAFVRRRIPPRDVQDVVQTILCDTLSSEEEPEDLDATRRLLMTIARRRVVDWYRAKYRQREFAGLGGISPAPVDLESKALAEWLLNEAAQEGLDERTLEWLLRAGDGEKLERIAETEKLPAPVVRKRVSRLRQWLRSRWQAELVAAALVCVALVGAWYALRRKPAPQPMPVLTVADDSARIPVPGQELVGSWVLRKCEPTAPTEPETKTQMIQQVGRLQIRVEQGSLVLESRDLYAKGQYALRRQGLNRYEMTLQLQDRPVLTVFCELVDQNTLRVTTEQAPWAGEALLQRVR